MESAGNARLLSAGALASALAASVCCLGPLALALMGLGGGALLLKFEPYRPYLLGATAVFLGAAFFLAYRRPPAGGCASYGTCPPAWSRKGQRILLVVAVALSLAWSVQAETRTAIFEVSGWTCASCASATRIALEKLDGVQDVKTDPEKQALVTYDDARVTPDRMVQAVAKLGYKATLKNGGAPGGTARSSTSAPPAVAQDRNVPPERVSFFEVPLECGAAEGLGCGSAAKPILTELSANSEIADARINYPGTVLAVVWKEPAPERVATSKLFSTETAPLRRSSATTPERKPSSNTARISGTEQRRSIG